MSKKIGYSYYNPSDEIKLIFSPVDMMFSNKDIKKCDKCGSSVRYMGTRGNTIYFRCNHCNEIISDNIIKNNYIIIK